MTPHQALTILQDYWGAPNIMDWTVARFIEADMLPGESLLATVARVAGVDVGGIHPFDHAAVRVACAKRVVELLAEESHGSV